jgi:tetratricopeptide (TPR) repeat protein
MKWCPQFARLAAGIFAVLLLVPHARADAFEDANRAFAEGQYAQSARGYESVLEKNGYSAAVLFDLGNADMRLGRTGDAILNYERAKWLAPHDPDIAANLRFARQRAGLAAPANMAGERLANFFSPNAWAWVGSAALVVLCLGIVAARLEVKYRTSLYLLNTVSGLVLIVAGVAVGLRYQQLDRAILPAKATPALISPFAGAKTVAEFSAGQAVRVERTHGGFSFVRDPAGRAGWVSNAQVAMIALPSTHSS